VVALRAHLARRRLFPASGKAVLAVSGGADSMAMLDLFATLAPELQLELLVAHVDHGIHPDSAKVAAVVAETAARRGLRHVTGVLALGANAGETRARVERYAYLRAVQAERGARWLVTAHQADDQAETVLLRILRGSGPAGLAGIPERGPGGLVRPLLPFTRGRLRAHAQARGLPIFDDPANADDRHMRSWVRQVVLPLLEARMGEGAGEALVGVARHARQERRAWQQLLKVLPGLDAEVVDGHFSVARASLSGYHKAVGGRIWRALAERAGIRLGPASAVRLHRFAREAASGRRLDLGGGLVAELAFERLAVGPLDQPPEGQRLTGTSGRVAFGTWEVSWQPEPAPARVPREGVTTWVDAGADLAVRAPGAGDRMQPIGGVGHRPVRRLLMGARVPRRDRAAWPILVQGGDILWVPGVCRAAGAVPAPGSPAVRLDARSR